MTMANSTIGEQRQLETQREVHHNLHLHRQQGGGTMGGIEAGWPAGMLHDSAGRPRGPTGVHQPAEPEVPEVPEVPVVPEAQDGPEVPEGQGQEGPAGQGVGVRSSCMRGVYRGGNTTSIHRIDNLVLWNTKS
jgi:hypothetical protein